ncbi:rhamnan synthesis F family protein [Lacrimispora saccharolytica]|nr:rhamnan synthesis F family protein [Lacrimispora saccharolytica]
MSIRLGIFYFSEEQHCVSEYVERLLEGVALLCQSLRIVIGGSLSIEEKAKLEKYGTIICEGDIYDTNVKGYQIGLKEEREKFSKYEEILLFDNQLMGPIYPLEDMFGNMEKEGFWGLLSIYDDNKMPNTHFINIRREVIQSHPFTQFIDGHISFKTTIELLSQSDITFKEYIHNDSLKDLNKDLMLYYPMEIVRDNKCPFFLLDLFKRPYGEVIEESVGQGASELLDFINKNKLYDMDVLWNSLLKICHQSDLVKNLHLNYILPDTYISSEASHDAIVNVKTAILIHIYRTDMAEELANYAKNMPSNADVIVTTDTEEKKNEIIKTFEENGISNLIVRIVENRGRDVSSKLVGIKDIVMNYEYICFIHDKKTPHLNPRSVGEGFGYKCFQNVIASKEYVCNIVQLFNDNPRLGILVPPEPNHGDFFTTLGYEWVGNYDNAVTLANKLGIDVPMSREKEPVAPFGSFFWVRTKALKRLYDENWTFQDFPAEPIGDDATILHAIERIYPFVAQQAGYYPAVVMTEHYAKIEFTNLRYYVQTYNRVLTEYGIFGKQKTLCSYIEDGLQKREIIENNKDKDKIIEELRKELDAAQKIQESIFWKMSGPIRKALDLFR